MGDKETVKRPGILSDLENGECGRKEERCPTPLELLAPVLVTCEHQQFEEAEVALTPQGGWLL